MRCNALAFGLIATRLTGAKEAGESIQVRARAGSLRLWPRWGGTLLQRLCAFRAAFPLMVLQVGGKKVPLGIPQADGFWATVHVPLLHAVAAPQQELQARRAPTQQHGERGCTRPLRRSRRRRRCGAQAPWTRLPVPS